jgi:N-acetylglucosamine kinase-like BadF-type ATPase
MIAIADSGSTKSSWFIGERSGALTGKFLELPGVNPFQDDAGKISTALQQGLAGERPEKIKEVYFYGAGCSDAYRCERVQTALLSLFPNARIEVSHDLLGAARSLCGNKPGMAAILGTGSNSCVYDGRTISRTRMNLGPLLGDEGSGFHLGKQLLISYFYDELPADLHAHFEDQFGQDRRRLFNRIYDHPKPHVLMASFTPFLQSFKSHPFIQGRVEEAFALFLEKHILPYPESAELPVHFTGSIAHFFQDILVTTLKKKELTSGKIVQRPLPGLVEYHRDL